uniref:Uncharacterized protein n=1 Tax=viral metagenome TaxID=1070528 RepID=A0A6H1ZCA7_9ZZZZ
MYRILLKLLLCLVLLFLFVVSMAYFEKNRGITSPAFYAFYGGIYALLVMLILNI